MEKGLIDLEAIQCLLKIKAEHFWVDYDEEARALYISFRKPQDAKDSVMEDDVIYHYDGDVVVGITLLNAVRQ